MYIYIYIYIYIYVYVCRLPSSVSRFSKRERVLALFAPFLFLKKRERPVETGLVRGMKY